MLSTERLLLKVLSFLVFVQMCRGFTLAVLTLAPSRGLVSLHSRIQNRRQLPCHQALPHSKRLFERSSIRGLNKGDQTVIGTLGSGAVSSNARMASWLRLVQRRMWTKMDYLHVHAISGAVAMLIGIPFSLWRWTVSDPLTLLASQATCFNAIFAFIVVANIWSGLRMNVSKDPGAREGMLAMGAAILPFVWGLLWFSGSYPLRAHHFDALLSALSFVSMCGAGLGFSASYDKVAKLTHFGHSVDKANRAKQVADFEKVNKVQTFLTIGLASIFVPMGLGGSSWLLRVVAEFPLQQVMLYDFFFDTTLWTLVSAFTVSLHARKVMTTQQLSLTNIVLTLLPLAHVWWDCVSLGPAAVFNPLAYFLL